MEKPRFISRDLQVNGKEYVSLVRSLVERYRQSQIKAAIKVNTALLEYYWDLGRDIARLKADAKWGSAFFDSLSLDLQAEFPGQTGFSSLNLRFAYRWYCFYTQRDTILYQVGKEIRYQVGNEFGSQDGNQILHQVGEENRQQVVDNLEMPIYFGKVPWKTHVYIFTHSKSVKEALFYVEKTIQQSWSRRQLELAMEAKLIEHQGQAVTNFEEKLPAPQSGLAQSILKSPYLFDFVDASKVKNERNLEDQLAGDVTRFLLELGQGFAYVGRQMQLQMPGGQTFIPDMIFYHTRLKCYVVVELKVVEFDPDFAGKLNFYVSAVDELMKQPDDNPTIGLLICKSKDDTVVEWSFRGMSAPLGVAEYKFLPSEEDLQKLIKDL